MKVNSFTLLDHGRDGIQADIIRPIYKESLGITINDRAPAYKRPVPVPHNIYTAVQSLKFNFLILSGYWQEGWSELDVIGDNNQIDREKVNVPGYAGLVTIWDNTFITKVKYSEKKSSFQITADVKVIGDKSMSISTVEVTESDINYFSEYHKCIEEIQDVFEVVRSFLEDDNFTMMNPRLFLKKFYADDAGQLERLDEEDESVVQKEMITKLEEQGHIIISPEEGLLGITDGDNDPSEEDENDPIDMDDDTMVDNEFD